MSAPFEQCLSTNTSPVCCVRQICCLLRTGWTPLACRTGGGPSRSVTVTVPVPVTGRCAVCGSVCRPSTTVPAWTRKCCAPGRRRPTDCRPPEPPSHRSVIYSTATVTQVSHLQYSHRHTGQSSTVQPPSHRSVIYSTATVTQVSHLQYSRRHTGQSSTVQPPSPRSVTYSTATVTQVSHLQYSHRHTGQSSTVQPPSHRSVTYSTATVTQVSHLQYGRRHTGHSPTLSPTVQQQSPRSVINSIAAVTQVGQVPSVTYGAAAVARVSLLLSHTVLRSVPVTYSTQVSPCHIQYPVQFPATYSTVYLHNCTYRNDPNSSIHGYLRGYFKVLYN